MSESADKTTTSAPSDDAPGAVTDDQLPEDLRPTDDNPLAKPLDEDGEAPTLSAPGTGDLSA